MRLQRFGKFLAVLVPVLIVLLLAGTGIAPAAGHAAQGTERGTGPSAEKPADCTASTPQASSQAEDESGEARARVVEVEEEWEMEDGIHLPVSVFYPEGREETYPAIIFVHPWDCDKTIFEHMARDFAAKGYVTVTYTVRGWYGAEGEINVMDPGNEMKDLSRIITLLSSDPRFPVLHDELGPVVGVTGYSMGGCHSFLIAPRKDPLPGDPGDPRVRAVVPMHGGADLLFSIYPQGTVKMVWGTFLLLGAYMGNLSGFMLNAVDILLDSSTEGLQKIFDLIDAFWKMLPPWNNVTPELPWIYGVAMQRRVEEEDEAKQFFRERSARYWCDQEMDGRVEHPITCPMLIIAGWNDDIFYANEGLRILSTCMEAPARMIITNHGHLGGMVGDFIVDLPESPESRWIYQEMERWFDRYLKEIDNGVDREPAVMFYRHDNPEVYGEGSCYPLPGTSWTSLYLGDGAGGGPDLLTEAPGNWFSWPDVLVNTGITGSITLPYFQDASELVGGETLYIPTRIKLLEIPFTECSFQSDPLEEGLVIMGTPLFEFYYQSQREFAQLFPFLYEVTPEGEEILVSRGWYEGQKLVPWALSDTGGPLEMQAVYHRFRAGSRIKLVVATADLLTAWPFWGLNVILLQHSKNAPSRIILPVVPSG